jgi:Cysteine-rich CWC
MVDTTSTEPCWCRALPTAAAAQVLRDANGNAKTCLCPDCLSALRAQQSAETGKALRPS